MASISKPFENAGFKKMMAEIKSGNHRGGAVTPWGWGHLNNNNAKLMAYYDKRNVTASKKSKQHNDEEKENQPHSKDDGEHLSLALRRITDNCDQIRDKINTFMNDDSMEVGQFRKAIGVRAPSYTLFMKQKGPHAGYDNETYRKAHLFFKKRELEKASSLKERRPPKKPLGPSASSGRFKVDFSGRRPVEEDEGKDENGNLTLGFRRITLNCDQIREKVTSFLSSGVMKACEFQIAIGVKTSSYNLFMKQKGPHAGYSSDTYRNSHLFFKKRELQEASVAREKAVAKKVKMALRRSDTSGLDTYDSSGITLVDGEDSDGKDKHNQADKVNDGINNCVDNGYDSDLEFRRITHDCNEMRDKIRAFIKNSDMKMCEFQKAIGVSASSYRFFMNEKGPRGGFNSKTYVHAHVFFKARERKGLLWPEEKPTGTDAPAKKRAPAREAPPGPEEYNVDNIELYDEADGKVPIFETCDSMREIVREHLSQPDVKQAEFLREVSKCFGDNPKKMSAAQLNSFMEKDGPHAGAIGAFFYGAYVYFEKLRIKNGEEESDFRQDMEDIWDISGGFPRHGDREAYVVRVDTELFHDEFGRTRCF